MKFQPIDSAAAKEDALLIYGRNFLLKITENKDSERIAEKESVRNLLGVNDLYTKEKKEAIYMIKRLNDDLNLFFSPDEAFEVPRWMGIEDGMSPRESSKAILDSIAYQVFWRRAKSTTRDTPYIPPFIGYIGPSDESVKDTTKATRFMEEKLLASLRKRALVNGTKRMKKLLQKTDGEMIEASRRIVGTDSVSSILAPTNLFLCPECDAFMHTATGGLESSAQKESTNRRPMLQVGEFLERAYCPFCSKNYSREDVKRLPIHVLKEEISELLDGDRWFEMYMAKQMRMLGWDKVWTRCMVMGATGSIHEIDVLALKDDRLATIECKTGNVKREDIFTYWTKASDIRSQFNIFASILTLPDADTRRFAKSYPGFLCLESMGEMSYEQLKAKMTSYLGVAGA